MLPLCCIESTTASGGVARSIKTPASTYFCSPSPDCRMESCRLKFTACAADAMVKAGGRVGIGSHGQLQGLGYHWELWSVASGGMTAMNALRAATLMGAQAIGLHEDLGSLEAGKLADLVVLDRNPLESIRNTNSVRMVMKNGRLYDAETLDETYPRQRKMDRMPGTPEKPVTAAGVR